MTPKRILGYLRLQIFETSKLSDYLNYEKSSLRIYNSGYSINMKSNARTRNSNCFKRNSREIAHS